MYFSFLGWFDLKLLDYFGSLVKEKIGLRLQAVGCGRKSDNFLYNHSILDTTLLVRRAPALFEAYKFLFFSLTDRTLIR